ncbi:MULTISPECIES: type II toxin-antitoxin system VapC family toxin [unclassified Rhizobium]|uniref:type II toxin-antitoxin system VapC family toxin n=1 Tax=unclassified Rhizobium TaxID=2613769 RepID=UPI00247846EA|nr:MULTISPECIES: type II toxin-antitoxin system VapC family toxin [unclassified Rhizobium]MDH7800401.1 putative nucleic acid-binding protein [Rhizobium sp. AN70]
MSNGFLLDTNIISRFAPDKPTPSEAARTWFHVQGEAYALYLSAMTIAEIQKGIGYLDRKGAVGRAKRLNDWLNALTENFGDRILPMDIVVARVAGAMEDMANSKGRHPGLGDLIIAATAQVYSLTVITENLKHFLPLGIQVDLPSSLQK